MIKAIAPAAAGAPLWRPAPEPGSLPPAGTIAHEELPRSLAWTLPDPAGQEIS